ncbi:Hypothetical predicted protein, partial [Pelobates cultripes]
MKPALSGACWRCKESPGTVIHMWWTCTTLDSLWSDTQTLIQTVTGKTLQRNPEHYLLQYIPTQFTKSERYLIYHFTAAVLFSISKTWLQKTPPTISSGISQIDSTK